MVDPMQAAIPMDILLNTIIHDHILPGQVGEFIHTPIEVEPDVDREILTPIGEMPEG
jgi:hypothetical protein